MIYLGQNNLLIDFEKKCIPTSISTLLMYLTQIYTSLETAQEKEEARTLPSFPLKLNFLLGPRIFPHKQLQNWGVVKVD